MTQLAPVRWLEPIDVLYVPTRHVRSAQEASEQALRSVQEALYPAYPMRATAWYAHWTLINLLGLDEDQGYRQVQEGYWRSLLEYVVEDLAETSSRRLVLVDLPSMLNEVRFTRGRIEAQELAAALSRLRRLYPNTFGD